MALNEEQILKNNHISSDEIKSDINETQKEIDAYEEDIKILLKNPPYDELDIYMRERKILKRKEFIDNLQSILDYRENKKKQESI